MSAITIHTEKNELIWNKASEFQINWLKLYHNIHQKTLFLLSGGSVVKIHSDLAKFINNSKLNFDFLAFAQVDERFQSGRMEDINAYQIEKSGLWEVCKKKNIPYDLISQEGTLEQAAKKYNRRLQEFFEHFTYKIGVLGIGEDAHTAGLLPGYETSWNVNSQVVGYELEGLFRQRITITPKALLQLDQAIVVVVGGKKKEAVKNVINPLNIDNFDKYPAAILQKINRVDLFTDISGLTNPSKEIK